MVILLTVFQKSLNVLYNTVKFSSGYFLLQFKKKKKRVRCCLVSVVLLYPVNLESSASFAK